MTETLIAGLYRSARRTRVGINGHMHTVIDLTAMEGIGYEHQGSIEFPPPGERGWATTRVGSHRFAAWTEATEVVR